jgi:hypothetical protein
MNHQRSFFDDEFSADMEAKRHARRTDPPTSHEAAEDLVKSGRMEGQCAEILQRLRKGKASSEDLAYYSLKYTARISDLRQRGYVIEASQDEGVWWYTLKESE